jgi:hypothetical protein
MGCVTQPLRTFARDTALLDIGDGLLVDAGRASVGAEQLPCPLQNIAAVELV